MAMPKTRYGLRNWAGCREFNVFVHVCMCLFMCVCVWVVGGLHGLDAQNLISSRLKPPRHPTRRLGGRMFAMVFVCRTACAHLRNPSRITRRNPQSHAL